MVCLPAYKKNIYWHIARPLKIQKNEPEIELGNNSICSKNIVQLSLIQLI